jgi:hypothetical protein
MPTYKSIVTLTWKFDSHFSEEECLKKAKQQIEEILNTKPQGIDFDGFTVQVDLAKMKDRKKLIHLGMFATDDVFPFITLDDSKKEFVANGMTYQVRMNSDRYHVFKNNPNCVACGIEGKHMVLDMNPGDSSPHFNFYAEEFSRLVLMTKDHILAKSKGGQDVLENYATMCSVCNNLKANFDLTNVQVAELRILHNNEAKMPRKELRDLINSTREQMSLKNQKTS